MRHILLLATAIWLMVGSQAWAFSLFGSAHETVQAKDGGVTVSAAKLGNGQAAYYQYKQDGVVIRFFLVRDNQGVVRAALDACEACWRAGKGYALQEGAMLCRNCGMRFALNRIGQVRGGCNPHPFTFAQNGNDVQVPVATLLAGARYFPENKP